MKLDPNMTERNYFAHETIFAITKCYTKQIMKQTRKKKLVSLYCENDLQTLDSCNLVLQTKISFKYEL